MRQREGPKLCPGTLHAQRSRGRAGSFVQEGSALRKEENQEPCCHQGEGTASCAHCFIGRQSLPSGHALLGVFCCPLSQKSLCPPVHLTAGSMLDLSSELGLAHTVAWNLEFTVLDFAELSLHVDEESRSNLAF